LPRNAEVTLNDSSAFGPGPQPQPFFYHLGVNGYYLQSGGPDGRLFTPDDILPTAEGSGGRPAGLLVPTASRPCSRPNVICNKAVGEPLQEAMSLKGRGPLAAAIAKLREARRAPTIADTEIVLVDRLLAPWLVEAGEYPEALALYESQLARGTGSRVENLTAAAALAEKLGQTGKAQRFRDELERERAAGK
jgi:hypothetical protein